MIIKNSKLFSTLDKYVSQYKIVKEEDENELPFPEEDSDKVEEVEDETEIIDDPEQLQDPTETPDESEIPPNESGNFISGPKLAMFATTLLKAYQAQPKGQIPQNLLTVTANNANEVISFIEQQLQLDQPTNDIIDNLSNI